MAIPNVPFLTRRRLAPEYMDDPQADRAELAASLAFIRRVNRRLGGTRAALAPFLRWSEGWGPDETVRILDVGTGSADVPLALADWAAVLGHRIHVVGLELHPVTLELAREHVGDRPGIELVRGDALRLTDIWSPGDFDYAHAGMFLHHLSDVRVLTVLRAMDRLAGRGLVWNDLVRGLVGRLGVRVLAAGAPAMVRHDARVSVEAGFTRREAMDLAARVGLPNVSYHRHLWHRFTLVSDR